MCYPKRRNGHSGKGCFCPCCSRHRARERARIADKPRARLRLVVSLTASDKRKVAEMRRRLDRRTLSEVVVEAVRRLDIATREQPCAG